MGDNYEPEIGQMLFGQPWQSQDASELLIAALSAIDDELNRIMWNIHQVQYDSPFSNTGQSFKELDEFQIEAYSWNEEYQQPWNFKWQDIEVSWYKHMRRGTSVNREVKPDEIANLLEACLAALHKYERENDEHGILTNN